VCQPLARLSCGTTVVRLGRALLNIGESSGARATGR
jgi:hypothetical protein